jgi:DNA-binding NtrC family response regulator/tetratricopeptide (TPR) repeat protein
MLDPKKTIGALLVDIEQLQGRGEYAACYERAKELLARVEQDPPDRQTRCVVLAKAARSAYYLSKFAESVLFVRGLEAFAAGLEEPEREVFGFEAAVIRANVHRRLGRFHEALAELEPYSGRMGVEYPPALVAERLLVEGACHFYRSEVKLAEHALEAALGLSTHHADARMRSRALTMLGLIAASKGLPEVAVEYYSRAKDICFAIGDCYGEAAALLDMGIVLYRRGRFVQAEKSVSRARAVFEEIQWHLGACRCLLSLGNIEKGRRDLGKAMEFYEAAQALADARGFARERALALEYIGDIEHEQGNHDAAGASYRKALEIARAIAPGGDIEAELSRRLGELHLSAGDVRAAMTHLRAGLRLAQRLGDRLEKGATLRCMGKMAFAEGRERRGQILFRRAIGILDGAGCDLELARTHLSFAAHMLQAALRADGEESPMSGSDALGEAWRSAVEAGHLFGTIDSEYWKAEAERCIEAIAARRRTMAPRELVPQPGRTVVRLRFSPELALHEGFVAVSRPMLALWEQVKFASSCTRPVLITGETGTGKELVARLIHRLGDRAAHPFVPLNCAAVPDHLFESEFFGHRRGCFTGALADRRGLFEEAHEGTLFLDEIGELTTLQQVKLLRVLQEGKVRRLGENAERAISVRIISATNQNLEEKLDKAAMREDFFYRINAEPLHVPPLRERREDIIPLIAYFLCGEERDAFVEIEAGALRCLHRHSWPGNVRELISVLGRVKHMCNGAVVTMDMLPDKIKEGCSASRVIVPPEATAPASHEANVRRALSLCRGNKSAAARWLGISRGTLYKDIKRMGLTDLINDRARTARLSALPPHSGRG